MIRYGETLLLVEEINLNYQGKRILRDINFRVDDVLVENKIQGQVISLIGRSGIGKTQLFKLLAGFNTPNSGKILLNGDPVKEGHIGVVPQNYVLFNHRKIKDNLRLATQPVLYPRIHMYLSIFELKDCVDKYPYQLSGGQRQRISIIQQLLACHKTILLDEPFSGLDSIMITKLLEALKKLTSEQEELTIFIISHDLENSLIISDTALVLGKEENREGATIIKTFDLIKEGCAWKYDYDNPNFRRVLKEIKSIL